MEQMEKVTMGTVIASRRKKLNMTQAELADKMCVTDKAVSKWERGLSYPDVNSIPKLAEILGIPVGELMQATESEEIQKDLTEGGEKMQISSIIDLVFKAITTAMGVSVLVLSIMGKLDLRQGFQLLSIGMTCTGIYLLRNKRV